MNLGWLLLVLGLGLTEAYLGGFRKLCSMSQDQPFIWKSSLSGVESQDIARVGQIVLVKLMKSQIWHLLAGFMAPWPCWGGLRKWAMASACLDARHFSSSLYATGAFQAATPVPELRMSESE